MRELVCVVSIVAVLCLSPSCVAAQQCGDPIPDAELASGAARQVSASDALRTLRAAIGSDECDLCFCDVNNSGSITASDALTVLQSAVGQSVELVCPACDGCLDIAGEWFQSYVCYDEPSNTCERGDDSDFVIVQPDCTTVESDVLDVFAGALSGSVVEWTASEDVDPDGPSFGDYNENGTWTFSDDSNFTSESQYTYTVGNVGQGGPCRANARKGSPPVPVDCGSICDGASNESFICN